MAEGTCFREPNCHVISDEKKGLTRVIVEIPELKISKLQSLLKTKVAKAKNARLELVMRKDGEMGTVTIVDGKIDMKTYRIKLNPDEIGHEWKGEPDSYFVVENECITFFLKRV